MKFIKPNKSVKVSQLSFEELFLLILCGLGLAGMFFAFSRIMFSEELSQFLMRNVVFFVLFSGTIFLILFKKLSEMYFAGFSVILILFVSINWLMTGGLDHQYEYNMLALTLFVGFVNRGKSLKKLLWLTFGVQILMVVISSGAVAGINLGSSQASIETFHFQSILIILTSFLVLFAILHVNDRRKNAKIGAEILTVIQALEEENELLTAKENEVEKFNEGLEQKIEERVSDLIISRDKKLNYLQIRTDEIKPTLEELNELIAAIEVKSVYKDWLEISLKKLNDAYQLITSKK